MTDETLDQIIHFLRGGKVATRTQDSREWANHLDQVIKPQLEELAALKATPAKKDKKAGA